MKIIATYNIKGGVGKTASAVNLSYLAARDGLRVLLWDLDPQGAASFLFRVEPKVKGGSKQLIRGKREPLAVMKGGPSTLVCSTSWTWRTGSAATSTGARCILRT